MIVLFVGVTLTLLHALHNTIENVAKKESEIVEDSTKDAMMNTTYDSFVQTITWAADQIDDEFWIMCHDYYVLREQVEDVLKNPSNYPARTLEPPRAENEGKYVVEGVIVDHQPQIDNTAAFKDCQKKILDALDDAKVSIKVAIAWFTNQTIADKLKEKYDAGVDVGVLIYDDYVNGKYGVDLKDIPCKFVKATRGGKMHHKFCVIDNQTVVTGSYNWSTNAEFKNDENVLISKNANETATQYTLEYNRLNKD